MNMAQILSKDGGGLAFGCLPEATRKGKTTPNLLSPKQEKRDSLTTMHPDDVCRVCPDTTATADAAAAAAEPATC